MSTEVVPQVSEHTLPAVTEAAPVVATETKTKKLPMKKIVLFIVAAVVLLTLFTANKRISAIHKRNEDIKEILKDINRKHSLDKKAKN